MRFAAERDVALASLSRAARGANARNTIPILNNVLLSASNDEVRMTGTDMDLWISATFAAEVEIAGDVTLCADRLLSALKAAPEARTLGIDHAVIDSDSRALVRLGRASMKLPTLPASAFPVPEPLTSNATFEMECGELAWMLDRASYIVTKETPQWDGVRFDADGKELRCVGLTRKGVSFARRPSEAVVAATVPSRAIATLRSLLTPSAAKSPVTVALGATRAQFTLAGCELTTALLADNYAEYLRAIPTGGDMLTVDVDALTAALRRVCSIGARDDGAYLTVTPDAISMTSRAEDGGQVEEVVEATFAGAETRIGINSRQLLEALSLVETEAAEIRISGRGVPIVVTDTGKRLWTTAMQVFR